MRAHGRSNALMPVCEPRAACLMSTLHAWRHPRAEDAAARCIGRTELHVDPRRAKRLAHRIRAFARHERLAAIVVTSPQARCRAVGRWLARWGWRHRVDAALRELDFGRWDGKPWAELPREEIDAWCANFEHHAPGGGEPLAALLQRVRGFDPVGSCIVVTHGGWMSAALWLQRGDHASPRSDDWPAAPPHGAHLKLSLRR